MENKVFCDKCNEMMIVEIDEYWTFEEDDIAETIICPSCKTKNNIYVERDIRFVARECEEWKENLKILRKR